MTSPSMADQPHQVRLTSDGLTGSVEIDGTDITSGVQGFDLQARMGACPQLLLYMAPRRGALFEGLAHVAVGDQADSGDTIAAFLGSIEPSALERAALSRDDLDGSSNELARAMLTQLAEWAQGKGVD